MRLTIIAATTALMAAGCSPDEAATATPVANIAGPDATDVAGAETFLRAALGRYASAAAYAAAEQDEAAAAERGTPVQVGRLFTPRLAATLDRAYATEGGIDADPICMCQDDSGMVIRSVTSAAQADGRVVSTVSFGDIGVLVYTLERTPVGWRIAEVVDRGRSGADGDVSLVQTLNAR